MAARTEEKRYVNWVLVEKTEGKRSPRKPRSGWEKNTKMASKQKGLDGRDSIYLAQNIGKYWAVVKTIMNLR